MIPSLVGRPRTSRRSSAKDFLDCSFDPHQTAHLHDSHTTTSTCPTTDSEEFWNLELDDVLLFDENEDEASVKHASGSGRSQSIVSFGSVTVHSIILPEYSDIGIDNPSRPEADTEWTLTDTRVMTVDKHEELKAQRQALNTSNTMTAVKKEEGYPTSEEQRRASSIAHLDRLLALHQIDLAYLQTLSDDDFRPAASTPVAAAAPPKRFSPSRIRRLMAKSKTIWKAK